MTPAFISAVVDALLPGDSGGSAGEPPLPPGSIAGIDLSAIAKAHNSVFDAIAKRAGGGDGLIAATDSERIATVESVERAMPDAFRTLLSALLADYYESPSVLIAMGWRSEPPQPLGHQLKSSNDAIQQHLERVRSRQKLWRG